MAAEVLPGAVHIQVVGLDELADEGDLAVGEVAASWEGPAPSGPSPQDTTTGT